MLCGAIAQLVERMNGIHEVTGSTPVSSTSLRLSRLARPESFAKQNVSKGWLGKLRLAAPL